MVDKYTETEKERSHLHKSDETHINLPKMNNQINKGINNTENDMIIFVCLSNLEYLCDVFDIFMDEEFIENDENIREL